MDTQSIQDVKWIRDNSYMYMYMHYNQAGTSTSHDVKNVKDNLRPLLSDLGKSIQVGLKVLIEQSFHC